MQILITDIAENIQEPDDQLNAIISTYLFDSGIEQTIEQWRIENYSDLRRWAYPGKEIYLDAQVKLSSPDPMLQAEGQAQLDQYFADCLAVKKRFPKEA
jgi:hypothetical protein